MIWLLQVMPSAASISTFSVLSEDDQGSQHMPNQTTELPTNQLSSPSHFMHHGEATGPALAQPASFVASVQLTPSQLQDFLYVDGHFVYLQPRGGLARTAYDLQAVDHTHVSEGVTRRDTRRHSGPGELSAAKSNARGVTSECIWAAYLL